MELREGDVAENQNIRSSRGAAEYSLTFEIVLPGGRVQFCFSNSPAGRLSPIDKPASADRSGDRTRPPYSLIPVSFQKVGLDSDRQALSVMVMTRR